MSIMKHLLYSALMAVIMLAFAACSNDDILVQNTGDVSVKVPTVSLYQNFGKDAYQNMLGKNKNLNIEVRLLLYSKEGALVKELSQKTSTFSEEVFNVSDLPCGDYTVVALQTIVDKSYDLKEGEMSKWWAIKDKDKLSTLRVDRTYIDTPWTYAFGMAKGVLNLSDKAASFTLNPEPIGYLIDINYENTANTNFVELNFYYHNAAKGVFVNNNTLYEAQYNEKNTWSPIVYNYNASGIGNEGGFTKFCISTGEQIVCFGTSNAEQHANRKFTAVPQGGVRGTFQAGKYYAAYAIYDATLEDDFAYYIGDESGVDAWRQAYWAQNTVYFLQPNTNWNTTVSNVKNSMSGYNIGNQNGEILEMEDGSYLLWYYGKYKEDEVQYWFSSNTSGLYRSYVFVKPSVMSEVELDAYIKKMGYNFLGKTDDGDYVYESADKNTRVQFGLNSNEIWYVCFFDPNNSLNVASHASIKRMANKR